MQVITANRLTDGLVVFLDAADRWSVALEEARRLETDDAVDAALGIARAAVARQEILDPYAIVVTPEGDGLRPKEIKERIRAGGPTVASAFPDQIRPRTPSTAA